jgi:NADPH-dependent F420 reductase
MRIALIGGTGKEGRGLAVRWAIAGHQVVLGSRDGERARAAAAELSSLAALAGRPLEGGENQAALAGADLALLSVPYSAHADTLTSLKDALAGRILIDITVPLQPPAVSQVHLPPGQSAALEAQAILGPTVRVIAALHHVSSTQLIDPSRQIDCDVLVCGDDAAAKATVLALVGELGVRALDAGPLRNSVALESLTPVLLTLNKKYKSAGAGIRFTNLVVPGQPAAPNPKGT